MMQPGVRIASMLASGTEIAVALGLENGLVGISHECDFPPGVLDRPRVSRARFDADGLSSGEIDAAVRDTMLEYGSVYEVDADLLERLDPTLVLTQAVCEVCAVPTPGVEKLVAARGLGAHVLSLDAHTIAEILDSIHAVATAAGVDAEGERVVEALRSRLRAVHARVASLDRPRVLALEWLDPVFIPGHWVPEMIEAAGGSCLAGRTGDHSRQIEWSSLDGLDPDVLVIMPCGYGLEASRRDADRAAERLLRVAARAIAADRAWVVNGSAYFNRSGPRVIDGIEILARVLHAAELGEPTGDAAARWKPET